MNSIFSRGLSLECLSRMTDATLAEFLMSQIHREFSSAAAPLASQGSEFLTPETVNALALIGMMTTDPRVAEMVRHDLEIAGQKLAPAA